MNEKLNKLIQSHYGLLLFLISIVFLVFFRSPWAFQVSWQNDDGCYIAILENLIGQKSSWICNRENYYSPGAPLFWAPVGILAQAIASIFDHQKEVWIIPFVSLFSFLTWGFTSVIIYKIVKKYFTLSTRHSFHPILITFMILLSVPCLYYAIHWTIMPHATELFLCFLSLYLLLENRLILTALFMIAASLTRYNDLPIFLILLGHIFDLKKSGKFQFKKFQKVFISITFVISVSMFMYFAFIGGYGGSKLLTIMKDASLSNLIWFLTDSKSGIIYLSPVWIFTFLIALICIKKLSWASRGAVLWMFSGIILYSVWGTPGGDFGFRYLIGSYAAVFLIYMDISKKTKFPIKLYSIIYIVSALWMTYLTFVYRTINTLSPVSLRNTVNGHIVLGVNNFFTEAILNIFNPEVYKSALLQQFPLYTIYISNYQSEVEFLQPFILKGPPLIILMLFTTVLLLYLIIFILRRIMKLN